MNEQVSIKLKSEVNYVYGTVNGVEATFTLTDTNTWSATVSKSLDGKYVISIKAYNSAGTSTSLDTIIYKIEDLIPLKTNWDPEDFYNAEDLNRVEINTQYISELANQLFTPNIKLDTVVVDRNYSTIEFAESLNRVENNIQKLFLKGISKLQPMKTNWLVGDTFSFKDANRYEQNLDILYPVFKYNLFNINYCGTLNCGEENI
ncbi:Ig-like domain-containing protein [Clostridium algidicarnis]|uniref:PF13754 domain-containing protein n=1 Tax=Clostridium algidicarnis TaxID=37659 RepID=UPI001C0CBD9B|nr:PF13754 domain-containing protein [Clostridium algidicarnis]MBU3208680.1 Ig-like domain-containing protein [Clostridium algidicarnis]